jgi:hypothetical protein
LKQACHTAKVFYADEISMVFAKHPEMQETVLSKYADQIRLAIPNLGSVSVISPKKMPPLQAADLFAWEYSHCVRAC